MSSYTQPWGERYSVMGDMAEMAYERVARSKGIQFVRYGLNRPPIQVGGLPQFIRYTPDYLTQANLVECKGFGGDSTLKIKTSQMMVLRQWNSRMPVDFFLLNSANDHYAFVGFDEMNDVSYDWGEVRSFPEGTEAFFIPVQYLEAEWLSLPT